MSISPPLIVDDHGSIEVYSDMSAVCSDIEAVDALEGGFEVFDAAGRALEFVVVGDVVSLRISDQKGTNPEDLRRRIEDFIEGLRPEPPFPRGSHQWSLEEMIDWLLQIQRGLPPSTHASTIKNSISRALRKRTPG